MTALKKSHDFGLCRVANYRSAAQDAIMHRTGNREGMRPMFNFDKRNDDFCRTCYRNTDGGFYCIQDEGDKGLSFYRCDDDYKPDYPLAMPNEDEFDKLIIPGKKSTG